MFWLFELGALEVIILGFTGYGFFVHGSKEPELFGTFSISNYNTF
jgi:hypothetical protein